MADISMEVKGLSELNKALKELPDRIAKNVLRGAVNAGAAVIRQEAKANAPVYTGDVAQGHPPPGTLKKAISQAQARKLSNQVQQTVHVGVRQGKSAKKTKKGALLDAYYWWFVENGTSKMAARPFLRPAFEGKKTEAVKAIEEYLAKRIPQEVEKLPKFMGVRL